MTMTTLLTIIGLFRPARRLPAPTSTCRPYDCKQ